MGPQLSAAVAAQVQMAVAGGNSPTTPPVVSPMANLMSITDTLPPGSPRNGPSPPQQAPQRSASRGSQHSTHSSGTEEYLRSMFMLSCCPLLKWVLLVDLVIGGRFWAYQLDVVVTPLVFLFPLPGHWIFIESLKCVWLVITLLPLNLSRIFKWPSIIWFTARLQHDSDINRCKCTGSECSQQHERY